MRKFLYNFKSTQIICVAYKKVVYWKLPCHIHDYNGLQWLPLQPDLLFHLRNTWPWNRKITIKFNTSPCPKNRCFLNVDHYCSWASAPGEKFSKKSDFRLPYCFAFLSALISRTDVIKIVDAGPWKRLWVNPPLAEIAFWINGKKREKVFLL